MFAAVLNGLISAADRQQLVELWPRHVEMLKHNKIVYFFPKGVAKIVVDTGRTLQSIAEELKTAVGTDIYIHFDEEKLFYRIGQVIDQYDLSTTQTLALIYLAATPPMLIPVIAAVNSTSTSSSSISMPQLFAPARAVLASHRKCTSASGKAKKIPKPRNSWILYRQSKHHIVATRHPEKHTSEISTVISAMWKNETAHVKAFWQKKAEDEKALHMARYPGYRVTPRPSSSIRRRNKPTNHDFVFSNALVDLNTVTNLSSSNVEASSGHPDPSAIEMDLFSINNPAGDMERFIEGIVNNIHEREYESEATFDCAEVLMQFPAFNYA